MTCKTFIAAKHAQNDPSRIARHGDQLVFDPEPEAQNANRKSDRGRLFVAKDEAKTELLRNG